jgi:hypothetical protein
MGERRPLVAGIKPAGEVDPKLEKMFVHGAEINDISPVKAPSTITMTTKSHESNGQPPISRVPFTTRIRADFASGLKRESLERQLNSQFPNSLQEILEEALEPWMRDKGYLQ